MDDGGIEWFGFDGGGGPNGAAEQLVLVGKLPALRHVKHLQNQQDTIGNT